MAPSCFSLWPQVPSAPSASSPALTCGCSVFHLYNSVILILSHKWNRIGGNLLVIRFLTVHWGGAAGQRGRFSAGGRCQSPTVSLGQQMETSSLLSPMDTTLGRGTQHPQCCWMGCGRLAFCLAIQDHPVGLGWGAKGLDCLCLHRGRRLEWVCVLKVNCLALLNPQPPVQDL